ncbi:MAG TPA: UvrD-helicase domain-containing protein [Gemmatimonadales bacterium]|nr:UvrD-helicase domain-containing protein [Gemmatimonadales bacterium]
MDTPTPSQLAAMTTADEHVLVAAGAGTGKTTTVVGRILYLLGVPVGARRIATPVELRDIAAITYTNAAAADLKRKLRKELRAAGRTQEAYDIDGARIGTIHGFCGAILREFALRMRRNPGARVMEEGESRALAAETVHETLLTVLEKKQVPDLDEVFSRFEVAKVKEWARALIGDSARLRRFVARRGELDPPTRALVDFADLARKALDHRLIDVGAMDFDRMIVWTHELLSLDSSVRATLQRRIRTLIVDEFQDVDPTQRDIAYLLGAPEAGRPDTTRLMLVGDPKQSIYRFRRADVTVWSGVERQFAEEGWGRVIALEENFRSVPEIVGFVDASAGAVLGRYANGGKADYEVEYQSLKATRPSSRRQGPAVAGLPLDEVALRSSERPVELLVLDGAAKLKLSAEGSREVEARAIARRMRALVDAGARYKDIALLLTSWSDLDIYQLALEAENIPTYALLAEGFYERREVWDLLLALETVRDPRDDRALFGFLRSPFVGVRDETLLDIVRQAPRPVWSKLPAVKVAEQELLDYGVRLIRDHAQLRDRVSIHELLESLLDQSGYLAHLVALGPSGRQPIANVRKFLRIAREFREGGVGDFLRATREARKREDPESDERLFGQHEDVVTITSVHSAKGLEWPIVFWADMARQPRLVGNEAILIGRETLALKDPDSDEEPEAWTALKEQEQAEAMAELKRLWYVASTRARDRLILSGFTDKKMNDGCAAQTFGIALHLNGSPTLAYRDSRGTSFEAAITIVPADEEPATVEEHEFSPALIPESAVRVSVPRGRPRHSATELMTFGRCARRHWFKYVVGVKEPAIERSGPEWGSAVARGQVVHDVLEHIREESELEALLEVALGRWDPDRPPPDSEPGREYRERLAREITAVRTHAGYRALDDAPGRRRELEFYHLVSPDAFLQGKIDLAAPDGDGIAALDVKTGGGDAEALKRKADGYSLQRSVYVGALEEVGGLPVTKFSFHFAADGVQIGGPLSEEIRTAATRDVEQALAAMGTDAPALTRFPDECRFCGYKKVRWCAGAAPVSP